MSLPQTQVSAYVLPKLRIGGVRHVTSARLLSEEVMRKLCERVWFQIRLRSARLFEGIIITVVLCLCVPLTVILLAWVLFASGTKGENCT